MKQSEIREIWINRVEQYKSSNLTQKEWCHENGLKSSTLGYWLRKLDQADSTTSSLGTPPGFEIASVSISQDASSPVVLEVNDIKLSVSHDYDETLLLKLIKTLKKI